MSIWDSLREQALQNGGIVETAMLGVVPRKVVLGQFVSGVPRELQDEAMLNGFCIIRSEYWSGVYVLQLMPDGSEYWSGVYVSQLMPDGSEELK